MRWDAACYLHEKNASGNFIWHRSHFVDANAVWRYSFRKQRNYFSLFFSFLVVTCDRCCRPDAATCSCSSSRSTNFFYREKERWISSVAVDISRRICSIPPPLIFKRRWVKKRRWPFAHSPLAQSPIGTWSSPFSTPQGSTNGNYRRN